MVKKFLVVVLLVIIGHLSLSFASSISFRQVEDGLAFIVKNNPIEKKTGKEGVNFTFNEVSEIKLAFMGLTRLYQLFISSQDKASCNFTLSCSRFGMSAIRKFGVFHGFLMTSDRLQRCNSLGRKYYSIDQKTGIALDYDINVYYLGKTKNKPIYSTKD